MRELADPSQEQEDQSQEQSQSLENVEVAHSWFIEEAPLYLSVESGNALLLV